MGPVHCIEALFYRLILYEIRGSPLIYITEPFAGNNAPSGATGFLYT
jgi:hypothetical protein